MLIYCHLSYNLPECAGVGTCVGSCVTLNQIVHVYEY